MRPGLSTGAIAQAGEMLNAVDLDYPGARARLTLDALVELGSLSDIAVRMVSDSSMSRIGPTCSVSGHYSSKTLPPTLTIAESTSVRRRGFTALHEFGHHLQQTRIGLGRTVMAQPNSMDFEDAACDVFASRVLLPDVLVDAHIGVRGPTADSVLALFRASTASRAACCVRSTERLKGSGAVVLFDGAGVVSFAAARGIYPPARGWSQASTPLVTAALAARDSAAVFETSTHIAYRNGSTSDELYGQAAWCDGYLVVVLAPDMVPWRTFAPPRPRTGRFVNRWESCEICDVGFPVADICSTCSGPRCPNGHCPCTRARERTCSRCWMLLTETRFSPGSAICLDCS